MDGAVTRIGTIISQIGIYIIKYIPMCVAFRTNTFITTLILKKNFVKIV